MAPRQGLARTFNSQRVSPASEDGVHPIIFGSLKEQQTISTSKGRAATLRLQDPVDVHLDDHAARLDTAYTGLAARIRLAEAA